MTLNQEQFKYRGSHQPLINETTARFHELDKGMPKFYENPSNYIHSSYDPEDFWGAKEATRSAIMAKGNPEAQVKIYRAVPEGVDTINPGDWVTTSRRYAENHAAGNIPERLGKSIIEATTAARNITFGGNDAYEFGYAGEEPLKHQGKK